MLKIGLTGGIGSGKSTVSNMIIKRGIPVIDADIVSRNVLLKYTEITENIRKNFGNDFFDEFGNLKRKQFGNFIFNNKDKRIIFENIIMPYIKKEIFMELETRENEGAAVCVVDGATLIEHGIYKYMDYNILVWVDLETQIERISKRDKFEIHDIKNRINSQMTMDEKKNFVDFIINNSGSLKETEEQLEKILVKLVI